MSQPPAISRPVMQLAPPTLIEPAFEDPASILELIDRGAPYQTLSAAQKDRKGTHGAPWFRNFWALGAKVLFPGSEAAFHNPLFIDAAKQAFDARVVLPHAMMTNLNVASPALPPHLDLPFFRGAHRREVPLWMLAPMGYSGLFHRWAIPVASAIAWFYTGDGGAFEYWPDGFDQPSQTVASLASNQAVVADNEYMYHRVRQVGRSEDFLPAIEVRHDTLLDRDGDSWVLTDGPADSGVADGGVIDGPADGGAADGGVFARYHREQVRLSVLWKAFCFADQAEADAYTDRADDLTPAAIIDIFQADLRTHGIDFEPPPDLDSAWAIDSAWATAIQDTYVAPTPTD